MVKALKKCGHQVTLILKARTTQHQTQSDTSEADQTDLALVSDKLNGTQESSTNQTRVITSVTLDSNSASPTSPQSFEGDTDFSGLEKVLLSQKKNDALNIRRTSSAPQTDSERSSILEASHTSPESFTEDECRSKELEDVDGGGCSPFEKRNMSFEERLVMRNSSVGKVKKKKVRHVSVCCPR